MPHYQRLTSLLWVINWLNVGSNINEFMRETNAEIEKLQKKQVSEAKQIVLGAYSGVLDKSPVDTSLFKHNHIITVNSKTNKTKDESNNINENGNIINTAKFAHNDTLTIQNNLEYADALEAGHSSQASAGVYGVTEALVKKVISKRIKIK